MQFYLISTHTDKLKNSLTLLTWHKTATNVFCNRQKALTFNMRLVNGVSGGIYLHAEHCFCSKKKKAIIGSSKWWLLAMFLKGRRAPKLVFHFCFFGCDVLGLPNTADLLLGVLMIALCAHVFSKNISHLNYKCN